MSDSTSLRYCGSAGWLVGLGRPLPAEPFMVYDPQVGHLVGCNSLRCARCGETVRTEPGLLPRSNVEAIDLWTAHDLSMLVELEDEPQVRRLYFCRCVGMTEPGSSPLDPDVREPLDLDLPWRCGGHAPPALPVTIDGVLLDEGTDLVALVKTVEADGPPPGSWEAQAGRAGSQWSRKVYVWTEPTPVGTGIARAYLAIATGDDPPSRSDGLYFHSLVPHAQTAKELLEAGAAHPELFREQPDGWEPGWQLVDRYGEFVALQLQHAIGGDELPARTAVREAHRLALRGCLAKQLYVALAYLDPAWLRDHALAGAAARDGAGQAILSALGFAGARLERLAPWIIYGQEAESLRRELARGMLEAGLATPDEVGH